MPRFGLIALFLAIAAGCKDRSEQTKYTVTIKNDSSQEISLNASVDAPSGDESQCKSGEKGDLKIKSKSEASLTLGIRCSRKDAGWLKGYFRAADLVKSFQNTYKVFVYDIPIKLISIDNSKIDWLYGETTVPAGQENKINYGIDEFSYLPGTTKVLQPSDFKERDNWYYKGTAYYRFFLVTGLDVGEAWIRIDKSLITPFKACDSCTETNVEGTLEGTKYKIKATQLQGFGFSVNVVDGSRFSLAISCTDLECTRN